MKVAEQTPLTALYVASLIKEVCLTVSGKPQTQRRVFFHHKFIRPFRPHDTPNTRLGLLGVGGGGGGVHVICIRPGQRCTEMKSTFSFRSSLFSVVTCLLSGRCPSAASVCMWTKLLSPQKMPHSTDEDKCNKNKKKYADLFLMFVQNDCFFKQSLGQNWFYLFRWRFYWIIFKVPLWSCSDLLAKRSQTLKTCVVF